MKALLVDPRMPYSFWTFDQSMKLLGKKALLPSLSLMTVAALLPSAWELKLVDRTFQEITGDLWDWAEIVLVSAMIAQRDDMLEVIREARSRNKLTIVGGPYPSVRPDEAIEAGSNFVVQGEAEDVVPKLVGELGRGRTQGVFKEDAKPDLKNSPIPRFDLADMSAYLAMPVQTSRGCPYNCEFCDISVLYGRTQRYKKPDQTVKELQALYDLGWRSDVFVSDDNFIGKRNVAKENLQKIIPWMKAHGEPFCFWTQASVDLGGEKELIDLMTDANFAYVFLGIESPDEDALRGAGKYQNIKNPLAESVRSINANGLSIVGSFIVGFDNEKKGAGDRIAAFIEETNIPSVMVNLLRAMPDTRLWDRLKKEGRLLSEEMDGGVTFATPNFVFDRPQAEVIREVFDAVDRLYEPKAFLRRSYNYYLNMRPTRKALSKRDGNPYLETTSEKVPLAEKIRNIKALLYLVWRQGVVRDCRLIFWKQFVGMYFKNHSRFRAYLLNLGFGENLFSIRNTLRNPRM